MDGVRIVFGEPQSKVGPPRSPAKPFPITASHVTWEASRGDLPLKKAETPPTLVAEFPKVKDHRLVSLPLTIIWLQTRQFGGLQNIATNHQEHGYIRLTSWAPHCCRGTFFSQRFQAAAGLGSRKVLEGYRVRVNFHFQFLSLSAGIVSYLHRLTVSNENRKWLCNVVLENSEGKFAFLCCTILPDLGQSLS